MLRKVEKYIEQYHMIERGDRIVLGVSGGADSVSLFFVMLELSEKYNIDIVVVHVNHGIRGEDAKLDEEYVRKLCADSGVTFEGICVDVPGLAKKKKMSEEEAGRKVRYEAFKKVAEKYGCNKIAVAHNQNDVSETVLHNLFRGSGLKGLVGIEPVRGNLIRPLLCVKRSEIEAYLQEKEVNYHDDVTNFETNYTRNKIRLQLIPYAESEINEQASEHIAKSAAIFAEANSFIEEETRKLYDQCVRKGDIGVEIEEKAFASAHSILKKELIRRALFEVSGRRKDIETAHIHMILELFNNGVGKRVDLPYHMEAVRYYTKVVLRRKKGEVKQGRERMVVIPGIVEIPEQNSRLSFELITMEDTSFEELEKMYLDKKNDYTKWFDYDRIRNTVLARYRKTGDFFVYNAKGNRKKLKDYLIDQKVPAEKRDGILLLADGNHIMWAIGLRISEYYKVSSETKRVLRVKVDGGIKHD